MNVLPLDHRDGRPASQAAQAAHRYSGDQPVPGTALLDTEVNDHDVDTVQLRLLGVVDPDPSVEHLTQHQHLTRVLVEPAQREVGGVERDGVRFDRGQPQHRNEYASAAGHLDDEAQYAGLFTDDTDADHHVANPTQRFTIGTQHDHPRQPRRVYPVHRRHDYKE